jgi:putative intracellular protease/amidase
MPGEPRLQTNLPSIQKLRAATSPAGVPPFRVGIVIGPGYIPMDMVGVQTVFGLMPGAEIHLLWKSTELVEGFPNWWTKPTTAFADCPSLDVIAVPMLPPEIQNDAEVIGFVRSHGTSARYVVGICNRVVLLQSGIRVLCCKRSTHYSTSATTRQQKHSGRKPISNTART